ncbi:MarR family transcriptional regulator [Sphingobacterium sp. SRCM116780]|uniref:MarR family winged helix-turn-helix transcriptional regulator n=1 Tax=Sphingobacterium sp. SRCM116780 TaxID=2907623 RepID=UPI001F1959B6|nr:MarR family transcriptional regulator [Sphingobacterium sp. SRCM116780]UIR54544.1 MarR family transcriptional regulator [Sphingobacterium sp. SRCM116780]
MQNEKFNRYSFILERTAKKVKQFAQNSFSNNGFDITVDQWTIIKTLYENDSLLQKELAEKCNKDQPTLTRIVDILIKKGLTERIVHPSDRRGLYVHLTEEGQKKVALLSPIIANIRMKAWDNLTEQDFTELTRILDKIYNNLND